MEPPQYNGGFSGLQKREYLATLETRHCFLKVEDMHFKSGPYPLSRRKGEIWGRASTLNESDPLMLKIIDPPEGLLAAMKTVPNMALMDA